MAIIEEISEGELDIQAQVEKIKQEGNQHFGQGEYEEAADKYKEALDLCPEDARLPRSLLYSNLSATFIKQSQWEPAAEAASKAIEAEVPNEKALERRAFAYSHINEKLENAIEDYEQLKTRVPQRTSELDRKISDLKKKVDERNEALKEDMINKLKGLGDMVLKPFGLSTNSFQMVPNGEGGYSISMKNSTNTAKDEQARPAAADDTGDDKNE